MPHHRKQDNESPAFGRDTTIVRDRCTLYLKNNCNGGYIYAILQFTSIYKTALNDLHITFIDKNYLQT